MRDRRCPRCGVPLAAKPWGTGAVWECDTHGVADWFFEDQTHVDLGVVPIFHRD